MHCFEWVCWQRHYGIYFQVVVSMKNMMSNVGSMQAMPTPRWPSLMDFWFWHTLAVTSVIITMWIAAQLSRLSVLLAVNLVLAVCLLVSRTLWMKTSALTSLRGQLRLLATIQYDLCKLMIIYTLVIIVISWWNPLQNHWYYGDYTKSFLSCFIIVVTCVMSIVISKDHL